MGISDDPESGSNFRTLCPAEGILRINGQAGNSRRGYFQKLTAGDDPFAFHGIILHGLTVG